MGKSTAAEFLVNYNKVTGNSLTASEFMELVDSLNHLFGFTTIKPLAMGTGAKADFGFTDNDGLWINGQSPPTYGLAGGQFATAIGEDARSYGMRCTTFGAYAWAGNVSATAIGVGAIARGTHSMALGRGAVAAGGTVIGGWGSNDIWFANGQANYPETISNPTTDNETNPVGHGGADDISTEEIILHGFDAGDFRITPDPLLINLNGGSIALASGVGTGSGVGGEVVFKTAPAVGGTGSNTQLPLVDAGKFDSASSVDTRFLLLDLSGGGNGTIKRVQFSADDSAGAGYKTLKVAN